VNGDPTPDGLAEANQRQRRLWRREAPRYDRSMRFWERLLFGDARSWAASRAHGDVLEVAVGSALNLPFYPPDTSLTGIDLSPDMLAIGRDRARQLERRIDLREGDAHALAFPDASFDTVVCTFSLCNIPDERRAIAEMHRVLRPGGLLVLVDHVASTNRILHQIQRGLERLSLRQSGDYLTRRPYDKVIAAGLTIEDHDRAKLGIVERLTARKHSSARLDDAANGS
jgi:ubiquinone/menaquinone biosynthesis C-methylase UbiE